MNTLDFLHLTQVIANISFAIAFCVMTYCLWKVKRELRDLSNRASSLERKIYEEEHDYE